MPSAQAHDTVAVAKTSAQSAAGNPASPSSRDVTGSHAAASWMTMPSQHRRVQVAVRQRVCPGVPRRIGEQQLADGHEMKGRRARGVES